MTAIEAISVLNKFEECVTVKADGAYATDKYIHAKFLAINALEKRIPKKPTQYDSVPCNRCPNCHNAVKIFKDSHKYHYCQYCGQAIDWMEVN